MERELLGWLTRYGAPVLFFAQAFGIFGLPIPDELLLTVSGALIASGALSGPRVVVASVAGCLTGITLSYVVGRTAGAAVVGRVLRHHHAALERARAAFQRYGGWLLTFGYFIPGVRHVTAILAGSSGFRTRTFMRYAYPGAVLWCSVFLIAGYEAGDRWPSVARSARSHTTAAGAVILGVAVTMMLLRWRRSHRLTV